MARKCAGLRVPVRRAGRAIPRRPQLRKSVDARGAARAAEACMAIRRVEDVDPVWLEDDVQEAEHREELHARGADAREELPAGCEERSG
eukprot:3100014-Prymnesium_polylepis.1